MRPKTLLAHAGADDRPCRPEHSAIVAIDHQMEYVTGALPLAGVDGALEELRRLLGLGRRLGTPIFHVVHHGKAGAPLFDPSSAFVRIDPRVAPQDGEPVIVKSRPNAFSGTDLHAAIAATGRRELIVAGFQTHLCIAATAWAALDLGYRTTIVDRAAATRDLPGPMGAVVSAAILHTSALAALADRSAIVVPDVVALTT